MQPTINTVQTYFFTNMLLKIDEKYFCTVLLPDGIYSKKKNWSDYEALQTICIYCLYTLSQITMIQAPVVGSERKWFEIELISMRQKLEFYGQKFSLACTLLLWLVVDARPFMTTKLGLVLPAKLKSVYCYFC